MNSIRKPTYFFCSGCVSSGISCSPRSPTRPAFVPPETKGWGVASTSRCLVPPQSSAHLRISDFYSISIHRLSETPYSSKIHHPSKILSPNRLRRPFRHRHPSVSTGESSVPGRAPSTSNSGMSFYRLGTYLLPARLPSRPFIWTIHSDVRLETGRPRLGANWR